MSFIDEMHEAWRCKAAQLVRDIISDYEKYIATLEAERELMATVIEAARKYVQKDAVYLSTISNPSQASLSKKAGIERNNAFATLMSALDALDKAVQDAS